MLDRAYYCPVDQLSVTGDIARSYSPEIGSRVERVCIEANNAVSYRWAIA